jgi:hypothetical protein
LPVIIGRPPKDDFLLVVLVLRLSMREKALRGHELGQLKLCLHFMAFVRAVFGLINIGGAEDLVAHFLFEGA